MSEEKNYLNIVKHYEDCLEKHGDTHLGVDWPNVDDVNKRYQVMLELIKYGNDANTTVSLLDFGCGAAHIIPFIEQNGLDKIRYSGLDVSDKFIELCKEKYPDKDFYCLDILEDNDNLPVFDYIVMNGVFTEKRALNFDEMLEYFEKMITAVFKKAGKGIAFNVMSKHVDWEREDLFHLPFDTLASFIQKNLSRNFIIRNDYGLYEYTVYIYRDAKISTPLSQINN